LCRPQYLYGVMERNPEVTTANADAIVETIREISELVTWGDRHDPTMTEFFMEKRMLERMLHYLETGEAPCACCVLRARSTAS
jgi:protein CLEC16A